VESTLDKTAEIPVEPPTRRRDRELIELLQELRVALPGVQVLFGFLLIVPFSARFDDLDSVAQAAYFTAFISSAIASALLIAPSAYHRVQWRKGNKEELLRVSNQLALAGILALAVGIVAVVYVITALLYGTVPAACTAAATAAGLAGLWWVLPRHQRT
jgi:hypothetical protein